MSFPITAVPIFSPLEAGAFEFFGSGTFVLYSGRFFIVTAAHVHDGTPFSKDLLVAVSPTPQPLARLSDQAIVSPMPPSGDRRHDPIDVAIIPISENLMKGLCSTGALFAVLDEGLDKLEIEVGDPVIFAGYAAADQHMFPLPEGMFVAPPVLRVLYLHQVDADEAKAIEFDTDLHLVGRYLHPATRPSDFDASKLKLVPNYGMSGGSVWHTKGGSTMLAGIVTSWRPPDEKGYCKGTRLSAIRSMFAEAVRLPHLL